MPSIVIVPAVGVSSPTRQRPSVVLPEPDSPDEPDALALADLDRDAGERDRHAAGPSTNVLRRSATCDELPARAGDGLDVTSRCERLQALDAHLGADLVDAHAGRQPARPRASAAASARQAARRPSSCSAARTGSAPATSSGAGTAPSIECSCGQAPVHRRLGEQQPERVRVQRLVLDRRRPRATSSSEPGVEHVDPVAHRERDAQVVRDQDEAHATRVLDRPEQREDLALGRDVERRRRLVGDQHLRIAGEGGGDADALAHAARQLERVALGDAGIADADLGQPPDRLVAPRGPPSRLARSSRSSSSMCPPHRSSGLSIVNGSWNTSPSSDPRSSRSARSGSSSRSRPS